MDCFRILNLLFMVFFIPDSLAVDVLGFSWLEEREAVAEALGNPGLPKSENQDFFYKVLKPVGYISLVEAIYNENKLVEMKITITCKSGTVDKKCKRDVLSEDYFELERVLTKKYGEPDIRRSERTGKQIPIIHKFSSNEKLAENYYHQFVSIWGVENKDQVRSYIVLRMPPDTYIDNDSSADIQLWYTYWPWMESTMDSRLKFQKIRRGRTLEDDL